MYFPSFQISAIPCHMKNYIQANRISRLHVILCQKSVVAKTLWPGRVNVTDPSHKVILISAAVPNSYADLDA